MDFDYSEFPGITNDNDGLAWIHLHGLRKLCLRQFRVDNIQNLCNLILQQKDTLEVLSIDTLWIDWGRRSVVKKLAQAVQQCGQLIMLELNSGIFEDHDVKIMLSKLPSLRCLSLMGNNCDYDGDFGFTSKTCEIVVRYCPKLQSLDLSFHEKIAYADLCAILRGCPDLRELCTTAGLEKQQMIELIQIAPRLVCLTVDAEDVFPSDSDWAEIIESNGGRTLIRSICSPRVWEGDEIADKLSPAAKKQFTSRAELYNVVFRDRKIDPDFANEWERMFE